MSSRACSQEVREVASTARPSGVASRGVRAGSGGGVGTETARGGVGGVGAGREDGDTGGGGSAAARPVFEGPAAKGTPPNPGQLRAPRRHPPGPPAPAV